MTKQETYDFLTARGVRYEVTEHAAVYDMEELSRVPLPYPDRMGKNLFVRDEKRSAWCLITVMGDKRVDLNAFRRAHGLRRLSFASADELREILRLSPGAVTPLGLLNDDEKRVTLYLDSAFMGGLIGVHPCDNTATVWLRAEDLAALLRDRGSAVEVTDLGGSDKERP